MKELKEIEEWVLPKWHSDFGDPSKEFELLSSFCKKLRNLDKCYSFDLDCFEEGYMKVDLYKENEKFGELYIPSEDASNQLGLFLDEDSDEDELYFKNIDEGIDYFSFKNH